MFCPNCGAQNADDAVTCVSCGKSLKETASATSGGQGPSVPEFSFGKIPEGQATYTMNRAFANAINLVKSPATFMRQNKGDNVSIRDIIVNYIAVLAAIPFLATLIGDLWYRSSGFYAYAVGIAIGTYILDIIGVFVIGFIIWKLAPSFATTTTQEKATLLAAFVYTPVFLISILDIIPFISVITILGLFYGLYILYIGLPIVLGTPADKALVYTIVIIVVAIIVYGIIGFILGLIAAAYVASTVL